MSCTDPIADMLTVIRNGIAAQKQSVSIPFSSIKGGICQVLKDEGYISGYDVLDTKPARLLQIGLKYGKGGEPVIHHITRISTPGHRQYTAAAELRPVIRGLGITIVSTPKGILSDRVCRQQKLGGEVICVVK